MPRLSVTVGFPYRNCVSAVAARTGSPLPPRGERGVAAFVAAFSSIQHEIELLSRRRVDLEDLEHAGAEIAQRVLHPGRDIDHVVLTNGIGLVLDRQRAFAFLDDVDIVGLGVVVDLAARTARHQAVEMDVDLLGAERRIDELDLLAAPWLHRAGRTLVEMHDLEQSGLPSGLSQAMNGEQL